MLKNQIVNHSLSLKYLNDEREGAGVPHSTDSHQMFTLIYEYMLNSAHRLSAPGLNQIAVQEILEYVYSSISLFQYLSIPVSLSFLLVLVLQILGREDQPSPCRLWDN